LNPAVAIFLASTLSAAGSGGEHLLAGARHFRDGRYGDALVEFRVAAALGADGARAYAAASLVKLERFEEALDAFEGVPRSQDALLDYYRALACYGAQLYGCAEEVLTAIGDRGGPRIAAEVASLRQEVAARRGRSPGDDVIAWYAGRCADLKAKNRAALAIAYCRERAALETRRADLSKAARASRAVPASARGERQ
jgi:tetratricopeptide (TPR) repeat protein